MTSDARCYNGCEQSRIHIPYTRTSVDMYQRLHTCLQYSQILYTTNRNVSFDYVKNVTSEGRIYSSSVSLSVFILMVNTNLKFAVFQKQLHKANTLMMNCTSIRKLVNRKSYINAHIFTSLLKELNPS